MEKTKEQLDYEKRGVSIAKQMLKLKYKEDFIEGYLQQREERNLKRKVGVRLDEKTYNLIKHNPSKMVRRAILLTYGKGEKFFEKEIDIKNGKLYFNEQEDTPNDTEI